MHFTIGSETHFEPVSVGRKITGFSGILRPTETARNGVSQEVYYNIRELLIMAGLVPFNRKTNLVNSGAGFEDFYNMLDDFFAGPLAPSRNLLRDTFKIDIEETEKEYLVTAELPGIKKEEIDLGIDGDNLCISVNRTEEVANENTNFIHRERRSNSMSRRIVLANASLNEIKAKLDEGLLTVSIPKDVKAPTSRKIDIE